jgi:ADP-heptose:LPS heptosyltransferase
VFVGSQAEQPLAAEAIAVAGDGRGIVDLAGRTSITGLAGVVGAADLYVGNDSGPLHLAEALDVPTVGLYWCGNLINGGPFTRTRHRPLVSWQLKCAVCGADNTRERCAHDPSFVADIEIDDVTDAAVALLEQAVERPEPAHEAERAAAGARE